MQAYLDCRRHKRNSASAAAFEQHVERNLVALHTNMQYRTLMLDHARAVQFAAQAHGIVFPLGVI